MQVQVSIDETLKNILGVGRTYQFEAGITPTNSQLTPDTIESSATDHLKHLLGRRDGSPSTVTSTKLEEKVHKSYNPKTNSNSDLMQLDPYPSVKHEIKLDNTMNSLQVSTKGSSQKLEQAQVSQGLRKSHLKAAHHTLFYAGSAFLNSPDPNVIPMPDFEETCFFES